MISKWTVVKCSRVLEPTMKKTAHSDASMYLIQLNKNRQWTTHSSLAKGEKAKRTRFIKIWLVRRLFLCCKFTLCVGGFILWRLIWYYLFLISSSFRASEGRAFVIITFPWYLSSYSWTIRRYTIQNDEMEISEHIIKLQKWCKSVSYGGLISHFIKKKLFFSFVRSKFPQSFLKI